MAKKTKHRNVKFTAEEMAYEPPAEIDFSRWKPVGRGPDAILGRSSERRSVELEPDVAKVFKTSESVNEALRLLIETAVRVDPSQKSA